MHYCMYTRYADDITISKRKQSFLPEIAYRDDEGVVHAGDQRRNIIEYNDFLIHPDKLRLATQTTRQIVTGLTVNRGCNVTRRYIREVRAMIHSCRRDGVEKATEKHSRYYRRPGKHGPMLKITTIIRGRLEFIKQVRGMNDPVYRKLQGRFVGVDPEYREVIEKEERQMSQRDIFVCHRSTDKETWARPFVHRLQNEGWSVWFDEYEIQIGDSIRQKIEKGISNSRFGLVLITPEFLKMDSNWLRRELDGMAALEDTTGKQRVLPVWCDVTKKEVADVLPTVAGLHAAVCVGGDVESAVNEVDGKLKLERQAGS